ncbi:MAG TPA: PEP-CTERM sorting domain-containing protein [Verrucomicrobiota bacterium]|nr:hypothetical protein [Verrucomicrobiales bacterium]HRI12552.1 PEP-CTERM sorting domain-containing protein [Verrucomicrobiota bacterium]
MKSLLTPACLILCGTGAFAQGYINTFNAFPPTPTSEIAYLRNCGTTGLGPLLSTAVGRVELVALDGTILSPVKDGTGDPLRLDGLFSLGVTAIPGATPGQSASIILRAWDNSTGATYYTALARDSVLVTFPMVGSASSPSNFVTGSNFVGLYFICPEPSSVALAAVGLVGFVLLVGRRKR